MSRLLIILAAFALLLATSASAGPSTATMRVSVSSAGVQADRDAYAVGLSGNGRLVLINAQATDLVPGDTNKRWDVFVHDRSNGKTERVSVSTGGDQARATRDPWGGSIAGGISANGRYIVFQSDAPNLVAGDTNRVTDIFLHDRASGVTKRVSVGTHGQANGASGWAAISATGRYVAFESAASNLVRRDTNRRVDVFVRDLATGKTSRVSVSSRGAQAACKGWCESTQPSLSTDGRYVAFESSATNLVRDTNKLADVFVRDRRTGRTERVSVTSKGKQAGADRTNNGSNAPSISGDGRYVAFHSADSNLVPGDTNRTFDIFVHDRKTAKTTRISVSSAGRQANGENVGAPSFSADGRYVAFNSLATNLVPGDDKANDIMDVFVRDLRAGTTTIASLGAAGQHGGDSSAVSGIAFSSDDQVLAFSSFAPNFVPGDTNGTADAFLREFKAGNPSTRVEGKH
jgi:Tol biopolymer transport system component